MTYTTERPGSTKLAISVQVPYVELEPFLMRATAELSEETKIEGFRKGKAPQEAVKQKFGELKILEEAARLYLRRNFAGILEAVAKKEYEGKSFEPVGEPAVAITKLAPGDGAEYQITLSLLPPLELPDYKAVASRVLAGKKIPEVTEEEVASSVQWLRDSRAKLVTVNRDARTGDWVEIDFETALGGAKLEGGKSQNHPFTLGKGRFVPGFEERLIGMKAGDRKTFALKIAEGHREKIIAGKTLEFRTHMNLVQEREVPAWGDAFAKSLGNFGSAAEVEKSIRDGLRMEKEGQERERVRVAMVEGIAAETRAEIPPLLIGRELDRMISELAQSIGRTGLTLNKYLAHLKKTTDDLKKEWRTDAERRVKIALVLREIARREGIQPSEEEIRETATRVRERQGMSEEELKLLDREAFLAYIRGVARNERVFQFLETLPNTP